MKNSYDFLNEMDHRPWPLPSRPWLMFQRWRKQLFAHWPVPSAVLRPLVPPELDLDTYEGQTYVGITPFDLDELHFRWIPPLPVASHFLETNVRTYVRVNGRPGVFFFSLDAASILAVIGARLSFGLPYFPAKMRQDESEGWITYHTRRAGRTKAELRVRYRAAGPQFVARPGSLEHFLIERYALFVAIGNRLVLRGDIHHAPWRLQAADAEITSNTLASAHRIQLPPTSPLVHYSSDQPTVLWPLTRERAL